MTIRFFNTLGREIQEFKPIMLGSVKLYTCGPTVWNYAHIGNLRTYLFEDVLRRTLEYSGYEVEHVMNVTDVGHLTDDGDDGEDKMELGARTAGKSVWEIAERYTAAFFDDTDALNIIRPGTICKATDHVEDMIALIERLDQNGFVYITGGNVYFDTARFDSYGALALLDRQSLQAGARIAVDGNKRNPADFVLWFTNSKYKNHVMSWDSPWGIGYPGWHIECSAMSMKYLGEEIDIHCGGVDHIAVHHTNEIAQSEGVTGSKWVGYWMHGEWLLTESEKMAKSGDNFITLRRLVEHGFDPLDYRYFCLGAHYRSQLQYTGEAVSSARSARTKLVERLRRLRTEVKDVMPAVESVGERARRYRYEMAGHFANDINAPKALGVLWTMLKDDDVTPIEKLVVAFDVDRIFGLDLDGSSFPESDLEAEFVAKIREREEARRVRDFAKADLLREELKQAGIIVEDTPKGTKWLRK